MVTTGRTALATVAAIGGAVFIGLQFVRPELTNPPVTADLQAPPAVHEILKTSCYNCHSNETRIPWFDRIVPAYWLVASDVKRGRAALNFSEAGAWPVARQQAALFDAVNQIRLGAMPPRSYQLVHRDSTVRPEQLAVLMTYLEPTDPYKASDSAQRAAAEAQYTHWLQASHAAAAAPTPAPVPENVRPAPNGIAFPADYASWKAVSSTNRRDNHTMRMVLGNDAAIAAIDAHQTNPWPDGAMLAKIAWDPLIDEEGAAQTGTFKQVEFMIKDSRRYAATNGWGFARWRGMDLQPYGASPAFTNECVGCHAPMRDNDFVFTTPVPAPVPGQHLAVIASGLDKADASMSVLYGNDAAVRHARTRADGAYPAGSTLTLVTWAQQEDAHWFGASIPGEMKAMEVVTAEPAKPAEATEATADRGTSYVYRRYAGTPAAPVPTSAEDAARVKARIGDILTRRASVMP
jgi:hypothetical protein